MNRALDTMTWRIAIRQADMLVRRARDRAGKRHAKKHGGLKRSGEDLCRVLEALAQEVWALAEHPPADRDTAYDFDRKVEEEWFAPPQRRAGDAA